MKHDDIKTFDGLQYLAEGLMKDVFRLTTNMGPVSADGKQYLSQAYLASVLSARLERTPEVLATIQPKLIARYQLNPLYLDLPFGYLESVAMALKDVADETGEGALE